MTKDDEIRLRIKDKLSETGCPYNIYNSRIAKLDAAKLPAISIYSFEENATYTPDATVLIRTPIIGITLYVKGNDAAEAIKTGDISVDTKMDEMQRYIESKLFGTPQTLDKSVYWLRYLGQITGPDAESQDLILIRNTRWEARYHDSAKAT